MESVIRILRLRFIRYMYLMAVGSVSLTCIGWAYADLGWSFPLAVMHSAALGATMLGGIVVGWELHKDPMTRILFKDNENNRPERTP